VDEAEQLIRELPADVATDPQARKIRMQVELAAVVREAPEPAVLEQRLAADPNESRTRHQLAAHRALSGDYEGALEQFLELMRRDRAYGDDAGRRGMLQVFELLGDEDERVHRYRRLMAAALY